MKYQFECPKCKMVSFYLSDNPRERLFHCGVVSKPVPYPFEVSGLTKRVPDRAKSAVKKSSSVAPRKSTRRGR